MSEKLVGIDIGSYVFSAANKTITFSDISDLEQKQILSIINLTHNVTIYKSSIYGKSGVLDSDILTLDYDTSLMDDDDELQIFVWISDV